MTEPSEHLISLKLQDGRTIDFSRTANNEVHVCRDDHCVVLPKASGKLTLDLLALLESFGEIEEESDGTT